VPNVRLPQTSTKSLVLSTRITLTDRSFATSVSSFHPYPQCAGSSGACIRLSRLMSSFHIISRPFLKSCQHYNEYPSKLVERVRYGFPQLQLYHERFKIRQEELNLFAAGDKFFVPYWDVSEDGKVEQRNLLSEDELGRWLGDQYQLDPSDPGKGPARVCSIKPDPQVRFV
jgi:hypothetical protein